MFQSIEYFDYKNYTYEYKLIDSDFICIVVAKDGPLPAVIKEYEKRNLDVVKNLFLYNKWSCDTYKYTMNEQLKYLKTYFETHYQEINYIEKYHKQLVEYTNKMLFLI